MHTATHAAAHIATLAVASVAFHDSAAVKAAQVRKARIVVAVAGCLAAADWSHDPRGPVDQQPDPQEQRHFAIATGLPLWVAHLRDDLASLVDTRAGFAFAVELLKAIPVGVDVDAVRWAIAVRLHTLQLSELSGERTGQDAEAVREVLRATIRYAEDRMAGIPAIQERRDTAAAAQMIAATSAGTVRRAAESAAWTLADQAESVSRAAQAWGERRSEELAEAVMLFAALATTEEDRTAEKATRTQAEAATV